MNVFEQVAFKAPKYSVLDLSHDNKLTYEIGSVVPAFHMDVAPGERVRVSVEQLTRFMPLLAPCMQNFRLYVDSFFVPYRILGKEWDDCFNYAKDETLHPIPTSNFVNFIQNSAPGSLLDYLGFPTFDKLRDKVRLALNNSNPWPFSSIVWKSTGTDVGSPGHGIDASMLNWLSIPVNSNENLVLSWDNLWFNVNAAPSVLPATPVLVLDGSLNSPGEWTGYKISGLVVGGYDVFPDYTDGAYLYGKTVAVSVAGGSGVVNQPGSSPLLVFWKWFNEVKLASYGYAPNYSNLGVRLDKGIDVFSSYVPLIMIPPFLLKIYAFFFE